MGRPWWAVAAVVVGVTLAARRTPSGAWQHAAPDETTEATPVTASATAFAGYDAGLVRLDAAIFTLDAALASGDTIAARRAFRSARAQYKRIELFVEYYGGATAREMNGVPMPKAEDEDPETPLPPVGLQMVEAALFPGRDPAAIRAARSYAGYMRSAVSVLRRAGADSMPGDAFLFDAMRHEIARVSTLGIAAFDATVSGDANTEAAEALAGVSAALAPYRARSAGARLAFARFDSILDGAIAYLRAAESAQGLDRLEFLSRYAVPLAHRLSDVQHALRVGPPPNPRAWSARSASIYDRDAFDRSFFAATDAPPSTPALVALGRDLFFDPALSPTNTRSCASCHAPSTAFSDGLARAEPLAAHAPARPVRNTPTLINAALQPTLFADGRVRTLEDQATDVLGNASEMGGSLEGAAAALRRRTGYADRFRRAFAATNGETVSAGGVRLALAAYVRSLVAMDARFDRAVRGDSTAMSREERTGFDLFMGKAACGTCHFAPVFNGAAPPMIVESEPEVIGVPSRPVSRHARIDPDSGRFIVRRIDQHLHAFRTPTLRNVALTAPYMHNGVFRTLEQVIDFYDAGGGAGIGARLPHQTLLTDSLHLSRREKRAIVAFLGTLTDTSTR